MNKKIIITIISIILIVIITGISVIVIKNQGKQIDNDNQYTNISEDTFVGTIISNDIHQITVVPNKDELIRQSSFEIINAIITQNTLIYNGDTQGIVEDVKVGSIVKVTFDGKIYEVKPGKVIAQRLDIVQINTTEE